MFGVAYRYIIAPKGRRDNRKVTFQKGNVKVSFTLLNWIHNSRLSKIPLPPFFKGGNKKSPFVKRDLEGFLICST